MSPLIKVLKIITILLTIKQRQILNTKPTKKRSIMRVLLIYFRGWKGNYDNNRAKSISDMDRDKRKHIWKFVIIKEEINRLVKKIAIIFI